MSSVRRLASAGVSVWLDDLGRDRLASGELARLVADGVCGVTTNPSIFAAAVSQRDRLRASSWRRCGTDAHPPRRCTP